MTAMRQGLWSLLFPGYGTYASQMAWPFFDICDNGSACKENDDGQILVLEFRW
jgi:hypothetical protein